MSTLLDYERPEKYIVSDTVYQNSGTPVLTANKSFVLGYTNESNGIYSTTPVVIFDDFTTDKKYVDFPFKVKSSAIKILRTKGHDSLKLIFELMGAIKFDPKEHKRYYISEYQNLEIAIPKSAEQQKIADCLTSLDEVIAAQGRKVAALKTHKRGLMQQLFPRKGETRPRLRFPEFRNAPEWKRAKVSDLAEVKASGDLDSKLFSEVRSGNFIHPVYSNAVEREGLFGYYSAAQYRKGSITITARGTLGVAFYRDQDFMGIGRLLVLSNLQDVLPYFLMICWNHLAEIPHEVTSIPQLTAVATRAIVLPIPGIGEQQRIADCLSSLDTQIAAESDQFAALKTHKQGLMQQLFPVMRELSA